MAHVRGARRIKGLGIAVAFCGILLALPLSLVDLYMNKVGYGDLAMTLAVVILALMLGGIIYVAGWVVEGFLAPRYRGKSLRDSTRG